MKYPYKYAFAAARCHYKTMARGRFRDLYGNLLFNKNKLIHQVNIMILYIYMLALDILFSTLPHNIE